MTTSCDFRVKSPSLKGAVIMGLVYALIAVSIVLVMLGIAVHNMIWLMIVGLLLLVVTVAFTAVTTRAT